MVLGWEHPGSDLILSLTGPGGLPVASTTPGIIASRGDTWADLALSLPFAGQRDGNWVINVTGSAPVENSHRCCRPSAFRHDPG